MKGSPGENYAECKLASSPKYLWSATDLSLHSVDTDAHANEKMGLVWTQALWELGWDLRGFTGEASQDWIQALWQKAQTWLLKQDRMSFLTQQSLGRNLHLLGDSFRLAAWAFLHINYTVSDAKGKTDHTVLHSSWPCTRGASSACSGWLWQGSTKYSSTSQRNPNPIEMSENNLLLSQTSITCNSIWHLFLTFQLPPQPELC